MELKTGYKVVQKLKGEFVSVWAKQGLTGWLTYKCDRWTYPCIGYGPITVFDDYSSAYECMRSYRPILKQQPCRIVKCLYEPSREKSVWIPHLITGIERMPVGTVLAKCVKILADEDGSTLPFS